MDSARAKPVPRRSPLVLGKSLGRGAYGSVHQARWGTLVCAAKTFYLSQSDFHLQSIQKEITALQKLRSHHVIQFYRVYQEADRIFLLMELAENGSLSQAISKGSLREDDWPTKMRLANEIARGLAFIHQEGVLHRDLKSGNVLLTRYMEVKLADFGLAKIRSAMNAASMTSGSTAVITGTIRWMAPELLCVPIPKYSTKSDVFALGVVMWEMAANSTRPFKAGDMDALVALAIHRGEREILPDDTPAEYRDLVQRCWHQDRSQRPEAKDIVLGHDGSTEEGAGDEEKNDVEFEWSEADGTHTSEIHNGDGSTPGRHTDAANHDEYVGRVPETDDDVVTHMCTAAKRGNREAQLFLGWIYDHGHGVDKSDKDAFWWYRLAASHGSAVAQVHVAKIYLNGQGVDRSDGEAARWYLRAAVHGDVEAQYQMSLMYTSGRGVEQDDVEAARWYILAAENGHCDAQFTLSQWYSLGRGVTQSDADAAKWLTEAAKQGNMAAQLHLGMFYWNGQGVEQSDIEAIEWLTKAAIQGNVEAQHNLGLIYEGGRGADRSDIDAFRWFVMAAEQGYAEAQFLVGLRYVEGRGVQQSYIKARWWFTQAADQNNADAQRSLGVMYEQGQGIKQSDVEATHWYCKVADQGDSDVQTHVGLMYLEGRGVEQNDVDASKWFTKAAEHGDAVAQFHLGLMYLKGRGVEKNDNEAARWFTLGAEQGSVRAQLSLAHLYLEGQGVEQSDIEATKWLTKAAEQGCATAQSHLEQLNLGGLGLDQQNACDVASGITPQYSPFVLGIKLGSGSGTFGSVHEARWGNQPCAAKTFFYNQSDFHLQSIQKEISVLKRLRFRHIIQFYRTHEENGQIYLLMELAENGSLAQAINRGELFSVDWSAKSRLASEIAHGLAYIHGEGVLHHDIRSSCVLLSRHMEVKLADFGLVTVRMLVSAASTADQSKGGFAGTLRWMAPELLFAKKPEYTTKSDVYALGVVMWEMAANSTRPFRDQDNDALVAEAIGDGARETFPVDTPIEYREWAEKCWHQDPSLRPEASEAVQIHCNSSNESPDDDDASLIDFDLSESDSDDLERYRDEFASEASATQENIDQHIGQS
ncbi:hypothetical protein DFQ27_007446 [Actinomortierella ambigua]|uniref:Protein kinase domain-containing protein n=1 Tax=Actinomortierella ambigua TaxID=1343610 RepID=A0A9P6PSW8_9FUNG|nr:hypothetical protein DFQ27_007446 [Actinomortierella ambigua]